MRPFLRGGVGCRRRHFPPSTFGQRGACVRSGGAPPATARPSGVRRAIRPRLRSGALGRSAVPTARLAAGTTGPPVALRNRIRGVCRVPPSVLAPPRVAASTSCFATKSTGGRGPLARLGDALWPRCAVLPRCFAQGSTGGRAIVRACSASCRRLHVLLRTEKHGRISPPCHHQALGTNHQALGTNHQAPCTKH